VCEVVALSIGRGQLQRQPYEDGTGQTVHDHLCKGRKSGIEIRTQDILNRSGDVAKLHCTISLENVSPKNLGAPKHGVRPLDQIPLQTVAM
jgi:hypothetical protein